MGLTIDEIAGDMVRWQGEKSRRDEEKAKEVTPVIFRVWNRKKDVENINGEVIALFPTLPASTSDRSLVESYAHVGQHGPADLGIIHDTRPATPAEYASLKRELEGPPYEYKLKVYARVAPWMRAKLRAASRS